MKSTTVVFRVDSSHKIGTGHIKRCLALACELSLNASRLIFISRNLPGNISEEIFQSGYEVILINYKKNSSQQADSFDLNLDIKATIKTISKLNPDILIVDHYQINAAWESKIRHFVPQLIVIDDYLKRDHDCSYYFNQNYYPDSFSLISKKTPDKGAFIGTRYSLLGPEYSKSRQAILKNLASFSSKKTSLNCLVYFGGSDLPGVTLTFLNVLLQSNYDGVHFHIVVGVNSLQTEEIFRISRSLTNVSIHKYRRTLVKLISMCDFAVGSPGSTTWERMCLGVPSILISIAENQNSNLEYLARAGYIISAGRMKTDIPQNIKNGLDRILIGETLIEMKQKILMLVDGNGAKRVAEIIFPNALKNYHLRKAEIRDIYDCFKWANDPLVRANSIEKNEISWESHKKWFLEKLVSSNSKTFILEVNFLPVGVIRFDRLEKYSDALISLTIDTLFRGRGYGKKILSLSIKKVNYSKFIAFVKDTNKASMNLFDSAGFVKVENDIKAQLFRYELTNFN